MQMSIKKKRRLSIAAALLIIAMIGWRLWPRPIDKVISTRPESVNSIACSATVSGVEDGDLFMDTYSIQSENLTDADIEALMEILNSTKYRPDLRNLLPWDITSVDSGGTNDGKSANLALVWGKSEAEHCYMMFHSGSVVAVDVGSGGYLIYHPTERAVLDKLVDYIQEHGIAK